MKSSIRHEKKFWSEFQKNWIGPSTFYLIFFPAVCIFSFFILCGKKFDAWTMNIKNPILLNYSLFRRLGLPEQKVWFVVWKSTLASRTKCPPTLLSSSRRGALSRTSLYSGWNFGGLADSGCNQPILLVSYYLHNGNFKKETLCLRNACLVF